MAKKNKGGKKSGGIPKVVKTLLTMAVGGIVGEVFSPVLPAWASGAGLGIAGAGLLVSGFKKGATPYLVVGAASQAIKTAGNTKPVLVARASVSGAARALGPASSASASNDNDAQSALDLARRARGG